MTANQIAYQKMMNDNINARYSADQNFAGAKYTADSKADTADKDRTSKENISSLDREVDWAKHSETRRHNLESEKDADRDRTMKYITSTMKLFK